MEIDRVGCGDEEAADESDRTVAHDVIGQLERRVAIQDDCREDLKIENADLAEPRKDRNREQRVQEPGGVKSEIDPERRKYEGREVRLREPVADGVEQPPVVPDEA